MSYYPSIFAVFMHKTLLYWIYLFGVQIMAVSIDNRTYIGFLGRKIEMSS